MAATASSSVRPTSSRRRETTTRAPPDRGDLKAPCLESPGRGGRCGSALPSPARIDVLSAGPEAPAACAAARARERAPPSRGRSSGMGVVELEPVHQSAVATRAAAAGATRPGIPIRLALPARAPRRSAGRAHPASEPAEAMTDPDRVEEVRRAVAANLRRQAVAGERTDAPSEVAGERHGVLPSSRAAASAARRPSAIADRVRCRRRSRARRPGR